MDDEELAKLMREIDQFDASSGGGGVQPQAAGAPSGGAEPSKEVATQSGSKSKWVGIAAVGSGAGGLLVGSFAWFIPGVSPLSTAIGAALGGAITALVGQPPRWLR